MTCDFHIDVPWQLYKHGFYDLSQRQNYVDVDFPRMKDGGLDSAFFALYLSDGIQDKLSKEEIPWAIWNQIAAVRKLKNPNIFFGLEGGRLINDSLDLLHGFATAGVKYLTLTHNRHTSWADSATDTPKHGGLTKFGRKVIRKCNELKILVDISHSSDDTAWDALEFSEKPAVATHSGCRTLLNHPRNLSDSLIRAIAMSGGVIGIPFARRFVGTINGIYDHIDHVCQVVGNCNHVGIGSDLDGAVLVKGISGVQDWKKIVMDGLSQRGYSDSEISRISGENILNLIQ